jgi:hypothetical protein
MKDDPQFSYDETVQVTAACLKLSKDILYKIHAAQVSASKQLLYRYSVVAHCITL